MLWLWLLLWLWLWFEDSDGGGAGAQLWLHALHAPHAPIWQSVLQFNETHIEHATPSRMYLWQHAAQTEQPFAGSHWYSHGAVLHALVSFSPGQERPLRTCAMTTDRERVVVPPLQLSEHGLQAPHSPTTQSMGQTSETQRSHCGPDFSI